MDETRLLNLFYDLFWAKNGITRRLTRGELERIALERRVSLDELGDKAIPNINLNGKIIGYGHLRYRLSLLPDLTLTAQPLDPTGSQEAWTIASSIDVRHQYRDYEQLLEKIAAVQSVLLERAMMDGRHWTRRQFQGWFLEHPIRRYLSQWVIWGIFENNTLLKAFHVTNDLTLADVEYRSFALPKDADIGVVHPLHLSEAEREGWYRLLADYKIIQPFPQILRPVYTTIVDGLIPKFPYAGIMPGNPYRERMGWVSFSRGDKRGYKRVFSKRGIEVYVSLDRPTLPAPLSYQFFRGEHLLQSSEVYPVVVSEAVYAMNNSHTEGENPQTKG